MAEAGPQGGDGFGTAGSRKGKDFGAAAGEAGTACPTTGCIAGASEGKIGLIRGYGAGIITTGHGTVICAGTLRSPTTSVFATTVAQRSPAACARERPTDRGAC